MEPALVRVSPAEAGVEQEIPARASRKKLVRRAVVFMIILKRSLGVHGGSRVTARFGAERIQKTSNCFGPIAPEVP